MPDKLALCIPKPANLAAMAHDSRVLFDRLPSDWASSQSPRLVSRALCETDESLVQLLPYLTLTHEDRHTGDNFVFVYSRGGGGGESRLHGKLSLGIGGHVENYTPGQDLWPALIEDACREFEEEVGYNYPTCGPEFTHMIYDPTNPVGRVHLGLHCFVEVPTMKFEAEQGVIENGEWMPWRKVVSQDILSRLEPWSKAVAEYVQYS